MLPNKPLLQTAGAVVRAAWAALPPQQNGNALARLSLVDDLTLILLRKKDLLRVLLVSTLGCQRDVAVSSVAKGISPLSDLAGVTIGMNASELTTLRPQVQIAGYYGYTESLEGLEISYEVPGSMSEEQAPPSSSHLESVIMSERLDSAVDSFSKWKSELHRISAVVKLNPKCYSIRWPTVTAWLAVWSRGDADLFLLGQPIVRGPRRGDVTPASLRTGVTRSGKAVGHALGQSTRAPCETLARQAG